MLTGFLADFEGSLPAPHNPALSALLAPTDPSQAYDPTQSQPSQSAAGKRKAYIVDQADVEAVKKVRSIGSSPCGTADTHFRLSQIRTQEISIQDRYDTLRITVGGKKNASPPPPPPSAQITCSLCTYADPVDLQDFTALRKAIMAERVKPLRELLKTQKPGAPIFSHGASSGTSLSLFVLPPRIARADSVAGGRVADRPKKQRAAQQNIILLSSSPTALITMWNVKRFLEDGVYVLRREAVSPGMGQLIHQGPRFEKSDQAKARQQAEGNRRLEDVIVIYRTITALDGTGTLAPPSTRGGI